MGTFGPLVFQNDELCEDCHRTIRHHRSTVQISGKDHTICAMFGTGFCVACPHKPCFVSGFLATLQEACPTLSEIMIFGRQGSKVPYRVPKQWAHVTCYKNIEIFLHLCDLKSEFLVHTYYSHEEKQGTKIGQEVLDVFQHVETLMEKPTKRDVTMGEGKFTYSAEIAEKVQDVLKRADPRTLSAARNFSP